MKRERLRISWAVVVGTAAIAPLITSQTVLADNALIDLTSRLQAQTVLQAQAVVPAQNIELGCRQVNASTGVYVQPNLDSASQGIVNPAQTVRLETKGEGWARINQPIVGWVQSRYLTPAVPCDALNGTTTIQSPPQPQNPPQPQTTAQQQITALPPATPAPSPQQNLAGVAPVTAPVKVACEVLPPSGLAVRSQPSLEGTYLTTLTPGTHEFQLAREVKVTPSAAGDRRWVYITAPSTGWISLGLAGASSNLGGQECESL